MERSDFDQLGRTSVSMHEGERKDSTVFVANHKIQLTGSANTLV